MFQEIQHPNKIVSVELIKFLREIFKQNYEAGNWHMNPESQMYIREDYPEDEQERGVKPGLIVSEYGQVSNGVDYLSKVGYDPMNMQSLLNGYSSEEVFSGRFSVSGLSEAQDEAQSLAYLTLLSTRNFISHIVGKRGIHFINALSYSKPKPFKKNSRYILWESKIPIDYAISKVYTKGKHLDKDKFTGVDIDLQSDVGGKKVDTGVKIKSFESDNYKFAEEITFEDMNIEEDTDIDLSVEGNISTVFLEADNKVIVEVIKDKEVKYRSDKKELLYDKVGTEYDQVILRVDDETHIETLRFRILKEG